MGKVKYGGRMRFRWLGMSEDEQTVILKRFNGNFHISDDIDEKYIEENKDNILTGVVLDTETTGLDKNNDVVIEIGLRKFNFNKLDGKLCSVEEGYSEFSDPGRKISDKITRLTGITNEDVAGKSINIEKVSSILSASDIIIAHNAAFDRPFIDNLIPVSRKKLWACSFANISWEDYGFTSAKLEMLSFFHGFFCDAHRALEDSDALLYLLSNNVPDKNYTYLKEIWENAHKPRVYVNAVQAPFESKDFLKFRNYKWDRYERFWYKIIYREDLEAEKNWLERVVYKGRFRGDVKEISLIDNFKN